MLLRAWLTIGHGIRLVIQVWSIALHPWARCFSSIAALSPGLKWVQAWFITSCPWARCFNAIVTLPLELSTLGLSGHKYSLLYYLLGQDACSQLLLSILGLKGDL